jgi:hypothetical protein
MIILQLDESEFSALYDNQSASLTITKRHHFRPKMSGMTFYEQALQTGNPEIGHKHQTYQVGKSNVSVFFVSQ